MTVHLNWYCRLGLDEDATRSNAHNIPHVADIAGLSDVDTPQMTELLELLIDGYVDPQTSFPELTKIQDKKGVGALRKKFKKSEDHWQIRKIIFIASSTENLPVNLIKCLTKVARSTEGMKPRYKIIKK